MLESGHRILVSLSTEKGKKIMAIERLNMPEGGQSPDIKPAPVTPASEQPGVKPVGEPTAIIAQPEGGRFGNWNWFKRGGAIHAENPTTGQTKEIAVIKGASGDIPDLFGDDDDTRTDNGSVPPVTSGSGGDGNSHADPPEPEVHHYSEAELTIPGLTVEEVRLLIEGGEALETIKAAQEYAYEKEMPEMFRREADKRLDAIREQMAEDALTPEQKAERAAKERAEKLKLLEDEWQQVKLAHPHSPGEIRWAKVASERIQGDYNDLRKQAIKAGDPGVGGEDEADDKGGLIIKGDGEGGEPPSGEGDATPEGDKPREFDSLEFEASPERGLEIARGIIEQEALLKSGQFEKVDWDMLNQLYLEQKIHIEALRIVNRRLDESSEEDKEDKPETKEPPKFNKENIAGVRSFQELAQEYTNEGSYSKEFAVEIGKHFAEAHRLGLLEDLRRGLSAANKKVKTAIEAKEKSSVWNRIAGEEVQPAIAATSAIIRNRRLFDDEVKAFEVLVDDPELGRKRRMNIGELYAQFATDRMLAKLNNPQEKEREYLPGEFNLDEEELDEEESKERYWRQEGGWYINVYAKTKEQFRIAASTYIDRLQKLTSDPGKALQDAQQFEDRMTSSDGASGLEDFLKDLGDEMKARLGAFGGDHANEQYHGDYLKSYMDFVNKDGEGPNRWLQLVKSMDGKIAAALWLMDNDPRFDSLFTMYGSRGQLADMSYAQRTRDGVSGLHNAVLHLLVEEMVGVELKNSGKLKNLTKFQSPEDFTKNFNGLYKYGAVPKGHHAGDARLHVYEHNKDKYKTERDLPKELHHLKDSFRLGRIQYEIEEITEKIRQGDYKRLKTPDGKPYNPRIHSAHHLLKDSKDVKFYEHKLHDAHKAVHIAMEIYGVFGEKSKRGGGAFKTERKKGPDNKEFRYFVPIHMGEKFVQTAVTLTKMEYADDAGIWKKPEFAARIKKERNFRAKYRTARVKDAMKLAIANLKIDGYEAKLQKYEYDVNGKPVGEAKSMTLKRPRKDANGKVMKFGDEVIPEEVPVDFYLATHHPYANWTGHTYWSYQEEHRHLLLNPLTLSEAQAIKEGKLDPEDAKAGMVAMQLLILDPTLKRVRLFTDNFEDRERKLTMAAVEDSYQTHWEITKELYRVFFPTLAIPTKEIGIYYGLQDFGGYRKMNEFMRAQAAEDPDRFMRRGRRLLPDLHNPLAPFAEYLGRGTGGVLAIMEMMDAPVYRGAGTLALDKFNSQTELAGKVWAALFGGKDNQAAEIIEGLLLKLTNDADINLQRFGMPGMLPEIDYKKDPPRAVWTKDQSEFQSAIRKSFGRLERYLKALVVMESLVRNATGAFDLRNVDVLLEDFDDDGRAKSIDAALDGILEEGEDIANLTIKDSSKTDHSKEDLANFMTKAVVALSGSEEAFNELCNKADLDESRSPNTGSGKHSARAFFDAFIKLMQDREHMGGEANYPGEKIFLRHMNDRVTYHDPTNPDNVNGWVVTNQTIAEWLFGKMVAI
jgi:hypothetical protein